MKKLFYIPFIAGALALSSFTGNALNYESYDCTVTYTNSQGVTFSATESDCIKAYEKVAMFIEAQ